MTRLVRPLDQFRTASKGAHQKRLVRLNLLPFQVRDLGDGKLLQQWATFSLKDRTIIANMANPGQPKITVNRLRNAYRQLNVKRLKL